ncbi:MAG: hypothetical protein H6706_20310 [Myxococcales bacterium]|nr:hypothetical protein [Myxococcales bacterium]
MRGLLGGALLAAATAACSARPPPPAAVGLPRPASIATEAPRPATVLNDPTGADPPRSDRAAPFPAGLASAGGGLLALEQAHQLARDDAAAHAVVLRRVEGEAERRRLVHCSTALVHAETTSAVGRTARAAARLGLPPEGWFIALDPAGKAKDAIGLLWYRHLARYHRLDHVGTTPEGLEIYQYRAPRPPLGE